MMKARKADLVGGVEGKQTQEMDRLKLDTLLSLVTAITSTLLEHVLSLVTAITSTLLEQLTSDRIIPLMMCIS